MNLSYMRFWSGNLVEFNVRSPMVDFDHQTDKQGGQNLIGKREERKKKQKWTNSIRDSDREVGV